jgi:hypothetical protein
LAEGEGDMLAALLLQAGLGYKMRYMEILLVESMCNLLLAKFVCIHHLIIKVELDEVAALQR